MIILFPIIISILALIYVISPLDFLPEAVLGPLGFSDDVVAILLAIGAWLFYFSIPLITIIIYLILSIAIIIFLFYILGYLYKKAYGKPLRISIRK